MDLTHQWQPAFPARPVSHPLVRAKERAAEMRKLLRSLVTEGLRDQLGEAARFTPGSSL
jgi:hypothetical protein